MTNRKIGLSYPDTNIDKEPFIKHQYHPLKHSKQHFTHLTAQERHQKYIESQPVYDKFLIKLEDYFKRNHISTPLISVICTGIGFFITFVCIISLLSTHQTTNTNKSYHSLIRDNKHSIMTQTSNNIIKKIQILLISDIHLNKTNIAKVHKYLTSSNIKIDHLWVPGDFLNLSIEDMNDEKAIEQAENDLIDLLKTIENIHPNPVIIPGNHDPKTLFSTDNKYYKFGNCINIHNRLYNVNGETNLFMAGFGGSVPAFCNGILKWNGYPYSNEDEFGADYNKFIEDMIINNKELEMNNSVILFTHIGPSMCSTTMDWTEMNENKIITTGSVNIMKSMLNNKISNKVFLNIHGHTHRGFGQGHIGNVRIVNPGSLKGGNDNYNFALLYLAQLKDKTWKVDSVEFKSVKDVKL